MLEWNTRIRILNNPSLWGAMLVGFGIPSAIMGLVFGIIGRPVDGLALGAGCALLFLAIFAIVGALIDLGGGLGVTFRLTDKGVCSLAGKGARGAAETATLLGALSGSLSALGAGLAAKGEQRVFIPWTEVRKIRVSPQTRTILIKGAFGEKPVRLYCTPDNFDDVSRAVAKFSPGTTAGAGSD